jgi:integrase
LEALQRQFEVNGKVSDYVFCNQTGQPLDNKNFSDRVWYPLLRHLGLDKRRPYQMRHTAATLWLASGEAPEWIAKQLGHTSTEMLFRVYSRYVPNLTRQDGSAMERLLASQLSQGPLIAQQQPGSSVAIYVPAQEVAPMPKPKPRGVQGAKPAHKTDRSEVNIPVLLVPPVMHGQQFTAPDRGNSVVTDIVVTSASRAQPPPLSWGDLAASWMSTHPDQPLN